VKISKIRTVTAAGVEHITAGQIPSVIPTDAMVFAYTGSLANHKYLSLVSSTENGNVPCDKAYASKLSTQGTTLYSGVAQAGVSDKSVTTFDTSHLNATLLFALCYAESDGTSGDNSWADSGLRFTLPKVSGIEVASGYEGVPNKVITSRASAENRLPAFADQVFTYVGYLANNKYISIVQASLNNNNPCVDPSIAAATAGSAGTSDARLHSGVQQGTADGSTGQGRVVSIPQAAGNLLVAGTTFFTVCYAEETGDGSDTTWRDSYIRVKMSQISTITMTVASLDITHRTGGMIPSSAGGIPYVFTGSLVSFGYISVVDASLTPALDTTTGITMANPCELGEANDGTDTQHTGYSTAVNSQITDMDTSQLIGGNTHALCYAGAGAVDWYDSGMRMSIPELTGLLYSGLTTRTMSAPFLATNRFPQLAAKSVDYSGSLGNDQWVSLVAADVNNNVPCVLRANAIQVPEAAGTSNDRVNTGAMKAVGQTVTIPQYDGALLSTSKTFAVCYGKQDAFIAQPPMQWYDSMIRLQITKIETLVSYKVTHRTTGQIPSHFSLKIEYYGSLANGAYLSLIDSSMNLNNPCSNSSFATSASAGTASQRTPVSQAIGNLVAFDTESLDPSKTFSLCYAEVDGTAADVFQDAGLRLTVPEVYALTAPSGYTGVAGKVMKAAFTLSGTNVLEQGSNKLLQQANVVVDYAGTLPGYKWISIVDATLNSNNPCVLGSITTVAPESGGTTDNRVATGVLQGAGADGKEITIPQSSGNLLDPYKQFAVCYAKNDGSITDEWKDTYVRMRITKMETLATMGITHRSAGMIPRTSISDGMHFTYAGQSLGNNLFLSIVDETVNNYQPCAKEVATLTSPLSSYSGPAQAASGTKTVVGLQTSTLASSVLYAVCYAEGDGTNIDNTWADSGLRVTVPKVHAIVPALESYNTPAKYMTARPLVSNLIPRVPDQWFRHTGDLGSNMFFSIVEHTQNNYNPCVLGTVAAAVTSEGGTGLDQRQYSGVMAAVRDRFKVPQAAGNLLDVTLTYAVCYAEIDGQDTDTWYDTYVRVKTTRLTGVTFEVAPDGGTAFHNGGGTLPYHDSTSTRIYRYSGTLDENKYLGFVDDQIGSVTDTLTGCVVPDPCTEGNAILYPADQYHSGSKIAPPQTRDAVGFDTTILRTDRTYALCFSENSLGFSDSGIRLNLSKIQSLNYGSPARPITEGSHFSYQYMASAPSVSVLYVGDLPNNMFISLVQASINGFHPCANAADAAQVLSTNSTGVSQASTNGKGVTLETDHLDISAGYGLCYAEGDGSVNDVTWTHSGITVALSKIQALAISGGGELSTIGPLPNKADLTFTYYSTLTAGIKFSMVDSSLNSNIPCPTEGAQPADASHSGVVIASGYNFTLDTTLFTATTDYALCYAIPDARRTETWMDSGIRVQILQWVNVAARIASGAPAKMQFTLRGVDLLASDVMVLLHSDFYSNCDAAPSALVLSDGTKVRRNAIIDTAPAKSSFQLPSGSLITSSAQTTSHHVYNDIDLSGGDYHLCFCADTNGNGGCDDPKEFFTIRSLRVLHKPRLGRDPSYPVSARTVTGQGGVYGISGVPSGSEVSNGDSVFVAPDCLSVPTDNTNETTIPLTVASFDPVAKLGQFTLPHPRDSATGVPLTNDNIMVDGLARNYVTCYATAESLDGSSELPYTTLDDAFSVISLPRLGPPESPGHIQVVEKSQPDFFINTLRKGDLLFFKEDSCSKITIVTTNDNDINATDGTGFIPSHSFSVDNLSGKITTPVSLTSTTATELRRLTSCFVPAGCLNSVSYNIHTLVDHLNVVPQPTSQLTTDWHSGEIRTLDFQHPRSGENLPIDSMTWAAGMPGDMFVLKPIADGCADAWLVTGTEFFVGNHFSARVTLADNQDEYNYGGIARDVEVAIGKLNEMQPGYYYICYAPVDSGGDSSTDFGPLTALFNILEPNPGGPKLTANDIVPLGGDILVQWVSHQGYTVRKSQPGAWIALYKHRECSTSTTSNLQNLHTCYLAWQFLPEGQQSGQVTFTVADYKAPGEFEARFFRGDTLNGAGMACKGLENYRATTETYTQCVFETSATSAVISVPGDITHVETIAGQGISQHVHQIRDASMMDKFRREHLGPCMDPTGRTC